MFETYIKTIIMGIIRLTKVKGGGILEKELSRNEQIHAKGFDMNGYRDYSTVSDYKKIKVGPKVLDDAVLELGSLNSSR